jgi:hypothetical protein
MTEIKGAPTPVVGIIGWPCRDRFEKDRLLTGPAPASGLAKKSGENCLAKLGVGAVDLVYAQRAPQQRTDWWWYPRHFRPWAAVLVNIDA